jgi:Ankyrin repeats (3 copies)
MNASSGLPGIGFLESIFGWAVYHGSVDLVGEQLEDQSIDPSENDNHAIMIASLRGHLQVVDRLLSDKRVGQPRASVFSPIGLAAREGHLRVVSRLLQDQRFDPSLGNNRALRDAAYRGHRGIVRLLMQDERVNPADCDNIAVSRAAAEGHDETVDLLLEDHRVDVCVAVPSSAVHKRKRFERRERFTEICIALQEMQLPAWVTLKILKAAFPASTLPLHALWNLVCAVKHFRDKR